MSPEHQQPRDIGSAVSGLVRAVASVTPLTSAVAALCSVPGEHRARVWRYFIEQVLESYDQELEALWDAVSMPHVQALLAQAQDLTETSRSKEKLDFARKVVSEALIGGAPEERVELAATVLSLLDPLEEHHLRILKVLGTPRPGDGILASREVIRPWTMTELRQAQPMLDNVLPVLIATLTSQGLVVDTSSTSVSFGGLGRHELSLTEAGAWLLDHLSKSNAS